MDIASMKYVKFENVRTYMQSRFSDVKFGLHVRVL